LDWIKGKVVKINTNLSLPHVGWNQLIKNKKSSLAKEIDDKDFYFLNSYYLNIKNKKQVVAYTKYGIKFPSIIQNKNICGVQFHPEKSQKNGSRLLKNFFELH
jgi:glutamine amidotransferase